MNDKESGDVFDEHGKLISEDLNFETEEKVRSGS